MCMQRGIASLLSGRGEVQDPHVANVDTPAPLEF